MIINKTLKIEITQSDVESAIKDMIAAQDPTIVVDTITFAAKRAGNETISIKVDAHFDSEPAPITQVEDVVEEVIEQPVKDDEPPFEVDEEQVEPEDQTQEEEEVPSPKQSLFS